ncbi:MAG TPA: toll/interleukin-1 receptor domain-containing protein, partial [Hellea balneolensis]|nr:toll/interleukin-1 receptor domain-containing protein [Hellea balneolensis]
MGTDYTYKAFISYSHADEKWGRWLHRRLESYHIPQHLTGKMQAEGTIPKRLKPIFRDREDLAAADDLGGKIEQALAASENLIVICSPAAANSRWVGQEIMSFKRQNKGAKIFCLIVDGEPFASGAELTNECFPKALRFDIDQAGELSEIPAEPLAADIRPHADGKRLGVLKLISGILGVGLDDLIQRDLQKSRRRVMTITATASTAVLIMAGLTGFALNARKDAEARRSEAEGLVDFMLGDLRDNLEPVGRLNVLNGVALKALGYYESQDTSTLSCEATSHKARAYYLQARILVGKAEYEAAEISAAQAKTLMQDKATECTKSHQFIINHAHAEQWAVTPMWERALASINTRDNSTDVETLLNQALNGFQKSKQILLSAHRNAEHIFNIDYELADVELLIGKSYLYLGYYEEADDHLRAGLQHINFYIKEYPYDAHKTRDQNLQAHRVLDKWADLLSWKADIAENQGHYSEALNIIEQYRPIYEQFSNEQESRDWEAYRAALGATYSMARIRTKNNQFNISAQLLAELD